MQSSPDDAVDFELKSLNKAAWLPLPPKHCFYGVYVGPTLGSENRRKSGCKSSASIGFGNEGTAQLAGGLLRSVNNWRSKSKPKFKRKANSGFADTHFMELDLSLPLFS